VAVLAAVTRSAWVSIAIARRIDEPGAGFDCALPQSSGDHIGAGGAVVRVKQPAGAPAGVDESRRSGGSLLWSEHPNRDASLDCERGPALQIGHPARRCGDFQAAHPVKTGATAVPDLLVLHGACSRQFGSDGNFVEHAEIARCMSG